MSHFGAGHTWFRRTPSGTSWSTRSLIASLGWRLGLRYRQSNDTLDHQPLPSCENGHQTPRQSLQTTSLPSQLQRQGQRQQPITVQLELDLPEPIKKSVGEALIEIKNELTGQVWRFDRVGDNLLRGWPPGLYRIANRGAGQVKFTLWNEEHLVNAGETWRFSTHSEIGVGIELIERRPG